MFNLLYQALSGKKSKGRHPSIPQKAPKSFALEALESRLVPTTILRTSGHVLFNDLKPPSNDTPLTSNYASYQITNNDGVDYADAWVSIGNFKAASGPVVVKAADHSATTFEIGALPKGATKTAFFYLGSNDTNITAFQTHTITVFNGDPSKGKSIVSQDFSFTPDGDGKEIDNPVQDTIQAESNKVSSVKLSTNSVAVGDTFTLTVTGNTGTIGNAQTLDFSPATFSSWRADAYKLTNTSISFSGANTGTIKDWLSIPSWWGAWKSNAATDYVATYTFEAVGAATSSVPVSPIAFISSGTNVKHAEIEDSTWGSIKTITNVAPSFTSVAQTTFTYGGTGSYQVTTTGTPAATYSISTGSLPSGVTLDKTTGLLSGTPAAGTTGAWNFSILASNSAGTATQKFALTVAQAKLTITADAKSKIYGDADPALTYQVTAGALAKGDTISGSLARAAGQSVGSYTIGQGTVGVSKDYALTFVGANMGITAKAITVTAAAKSKTYGDADPSLTYSVTSGALVGSDSFTGSLTRASGESVGTYAINQGTLAAGSNYKVTYVSDNLTVNAKALTVTAAAKSKTYGDVDPALTYSVTSGALVGSDSFTGSLTRTSGESVGTYAINQGTLAAGSNYKVSYVSANLTVNKATLSITADAKSKTYGDVDPSLTYQVSGLKNSYKSSVVTGALTRVTGENVGGYAINQGTVAAGGNYNVAYTGSNLTVNKATLTVNADPKSKTYGDADPGLTFGLSGLKNNDTNSVVTGALSRTAGENAGLYAINQGTVAAGSNYDIKFVGTNLTVNQATLKVVADGQTKVYGDSDPSLAYALSGFKRSDSASIVTGALSRAAGANVGTYAIGQGTLSAGSNYQVSYFGANLVITTKAITVTPDMQAKTFGDSDPALTYKVTTGSLVSGDNFSGALARVAGENVGKYGIGQGTLTPGSNYNVTFGAANLTIGARSITVTADNKAKTYGNSDPVMTYKITTGFLSTGDQFTGALTRSVGENVGNYMIGQGTLAASANYNLIFVGANLTISQRNITVAADDKSKVYGETDPALTYQITLGSLAAGDKLSGAPSRIGGESAGSYAITKDTLTAGPNYNLAYLGANLVITPKAIVVTAQPATKVYGDVDPSFTYTVAPGGLINGDILKGSLGRVSGENVGSYDVSIGSLNGSPNYTINLVSAKFSITPREIGVTANPATKVYGNNDPVFTFQVTTGSLINGDKLTGSIGRDSGENIGSYTLNKGTLGNANYKVGFVGNQLTVIPRAITVTADTISKTYGDADPVLTYKVTTSSLAFGDTLTGTMTRVNGEKVGNYAVSKGTLASSPNYQMNFVGGKLNITQRNLVITAKDVSKTYGTSYTFTGKEFTTSGLAFGETVSSVNLLCYGTPSTALAGAFAISPSKAAGVDLSNYRVTYVKGNLNVTKANLTITANDSAKTYGTQGTFGITQFTTSGLLNGDMVNNAVFTSTGAAKTANVGNYPILGSNALGHGLQNYNINYVAGNLTVNKAALVITANNRQKTQGATANFVGDEFSTSGLVNTDTVNTVSLNSPGAAGTAALGSYAIVSTNAQGNGLSNYTITYVNGTMKVIAPEDFKGTLGNGTFTTDNTGKVQIDYRYDGGGYQGQMGIYSLAGMTAYVPGSPEYIKEVARRVLSASGEGYMVINDITDGAKHSEKLKTDGVFNGGVYKGVQTFQMDSNAQFGMVLIPSGTFAEVFANPSIGGAKRALFSNAKANPTQAVNGGAQLADITGNGNIFGWEDYRLDGGAATGTPVCDRDYNDLIFALIGAKSESSSYKDLVDPAKDITKDSVFSTILS